MFGPALKSQRAIENRILSIFFEGEVIEVENRKMDEFEEFKKERREAERKAARRMKLKKIAMWVAVGIVVAVWAWYQILLKVEVGTIVQLVIVAGLCYIAYSFGSAIAFEKGHREGKSEGKSQGKSEMLKAFLEVEEIKAIYDGWFEDEEKKVR
jgi:hypothetical protein